MNALAHGARGIYNVVDEDPRHCANGCRTRGDLWKAPGPPSMDVVIAGKTLEDRMVYIMNEQRRASNVHAKRESSWKPRATN